MKPETLLTLAALAGAAALVLLAPRAAKAATPSSAPRVGGAAGSMWDDTATATYRTNLAAQLSTSPDFWI